MSGTYRWRSIPVSFTKFALLATSKPRMIPIVFCASFPPCEYESIAELSSWAGRKTWSMRDALSALKIQ